MANPVLILHGWSDNFRSFIPLRQWFQRLDVPVEQVWLGDYASMQDDVTFDDLADGLQTRVHEMQGSGVLPRFEPFSLDIVLHSTGGPVFRHWLNLYLNEECGGKAERCPVRSVVMLAPANFGSRLAAQGKSALAKLFKGGVSGGFQTGRRILEGLELGSPDLWRIAQADLFGAGMRYPCDTARGPFVYILSGTDTYGSLKGLVARGANEDGSDGTIRASAASLNAALMTVDYRNPKEPDAEIYPQKNPRFAFRLVPGKNHSAIVPAGTDGSDHATFGLIQRCLAVTDDRQYARLREQFETDNANFYTGEGQKDDGDRVHAFQQFLVHVRDDMNNDVTDFRLDFHVIDATVTTSAWGDNPQTRAGLERYRRFTRRLQEEVLVDVVPHSTNPSYRTFYINLDALATLQADLARGAPGAYIAMNVDAVGPTEDLTYDTDALKYLSMDFENADGTKPQIFEPNTTTLVDITLQRVPGKRVFQIYDREPAE